MKKQLVLGLGLLYSFFSCTQDEKESETLDKLAREYVKVGLLIGEYDSDFVDAYYGPDSLKPVDPEAFDDFPAAILLSKLKAVDTGLSNFLSLTKDEFLAKRAVYIQAQLNAAEERVRIVAGQTSEFDVESERLFGVIAPKYDTLHFQKIIDDLEILLPGEGTVQERYAALGKRFIIPQEKLDTVLKAAIAEARKQTRLHYPLPDSESFNLEFVSDKSWSGYNWYKGNFTSLIQINTDFPISIDRVIDVGSHESYPGHHVYNMLLEENLYRKKGYIETSLYPLFSPQSFIAEGSANYGIELAFPMQQKIAFCKNVLLPLAGLDTTGITTYFEAQEQVSQLNYAGNEVARGILNGTMDDESGTAFLIKYGFYSPEKARQRIAFTRKYRSYVINYNYGKDLVKGYIGSKGKSKNDIWAAFGELLRDQVLPRDLLH